MSHVHFTNPEVLAGLRHEYEQKVSGFNIDKLVKSHFSAWIPAFAGMTCFIRN